MKSIDFCGFLEFFFYVWKPWFWIFIKKNFLVTHIFKYLAVQNNKKQYNTRTIHFSEIVYLKQRQVDMLSSVLKKLNLCPVILASRGVNPLATSHTVEHLSSLCLSSWSHDKPILYLIYHCLNKIGIPWNPW